MSARCDLSQSFKEYGNETVLAKSLMYLFSVLFPGNVQSQQIWGVPRYETRSAGIQRAAGEACVYLGVVCVCWDESNHVTMWKGRHTPPPHQNQIHPAGVIETHTHTPNARERRTESVFTLGLICWSELNFYSTLIPLSFHIILYSVALNHRGVCMIVGISHRCWQLGNNSKDAPKIPKVIESVISRNS